MYNLSILTICLTFFAVILSHRLYRQQHVNGQTFSNDYNYNGQQNNGQQRYGNQLSYPNYNRRPNNIYGSGQSGGVYQNRGPVSSSSNLELDNTQEWHKQQTTNSGQESTTTEETFNEEETTREPERTEPTKETNDNNQESEQNNKNNHNLRAIAVLRGKAQGTLYFEQIGEKVQVTGSIKGLSNGLHAFHVHQFGDLSRSCESSGDHYNPYNTKHGSPFDSVRHVGDLGNVFADESEVAKINIKDTFLSLKDGKNNILGHTIIVHESVDDLGRGGHVKSGRRVGCGIIGWRNDLE